MKLTQVKLGYITEIGRVEDVAWIDGRFAKVGKSVQDEHGTIWMVIATYGTRDAKDLEREYRTWREFQDKLDGH